MAKPRRSIADVDFSKFADRSHADIVAILKPYKLPADVAKKIRDALERSRSCVVLKFQLVLDQKQYSELIRKIILIKGQLVEAHGECTGGDLDACSRAKRLEAQLTDLENTARALATKIAAEQKQIARSCS